MNLNHWSGPMGLVNCCTDEDIEREHRHDRMRKWVDKASYRLTTAVKDLEGVHFTEHMLDEGEQIEDCIREALRTIGTATHLLRTLQSELSKVEK